ncbi:nicotinate-nucleotide adenylyltransferase [Cyanobium sp. Morenito 9A2]|uniref:nicotinate-nucleotide adenylyltransferase n=1 Tax=Cyanobium sp. Morenito 9A2 TaxID=2823718 RepID=UPI0020CC796C|nr:nicotinate-nucleotide adenylyltransferase [Cyanobium sp. Morenito 9A2]MCP9849131.1 nicotinate-nucleotide adenylyltransferase [Cyanobium sp. Morenito 9A2]
MSAPAGPTAPEAVALFGTSADPPSLGHRALLEGLAHHYPLVATFASDNPLKHHGAPLALRAAMLQALVEDLANPRLILDQTLSSPRAIESLQGARERWPEAQLVFVVGSDLVEQIPSWYAARSLLAACRLAVVPRQSWPLRPELLKPLESLGAHLEVLPLEIPATASSLIRQQPDPALIPMVLWPLLREHNLYGLASSAPGDPAALRPRR